MNKILLVGVARSGTTWVATILSKCGDTFFFNEPDDERRFNGAIEAKRYLTRYPTIAPGDEEWVGQASAFKYWEMWNRIFGNGVGIGGYKNLLVKSVFAPFCLEWLKETFEINHVVWVRRGLYRVINSWYEYSRERHPDVDRAVLLRRLAWQACSHHAAYQRLADAEFFSEVVDHEDLAQNAERGFEDLAVSIGLGWRHEAIEQLADLNAAGVGGHYGLPGYDLTDHIRRTTEQAVADPDLSIEELTIIRKELQRWPVT